ncbi:hypothetical protein [Thauera sinica]|uniref:DUF1571 domain-containing protein n=1 Tax=Thauera sinica TaxID=2665146 RepID=A0ABW1ALV0_9RHOO|nr:hypothetical protein [Thauera sp. K11]ATE60788.1 hypothetical protein CCZ27_13300 [Thauera sp. K11]
MLSRLLLGLAVCLPALAARAEPAPDYSAAEQLLFVDEHLAAERPPTTLRYAFRKSGSLEAPFEDTVSIALGPRPDGSCCTAAGEFLSGAHRLALPQIDEARSNPVILYFLEHDVRDMQRLTKGQQAHFRKRIRMAVYNGAQVQPATFRYRGRAVDGQEVTISPYEDDPSRARFERLARKHYVFMMSDAVPGRVYGIRSRIDRADDASSPPLMVEEMYIDGADAVPRPREETR